MQEIENFNPTELGPHSGFSHATRAGQLVVLGGQIGCDRTGSILEPGDIAAQFTRAIRNVAAALAAAGSSPERAIKLTYFVTDLASYRARLPEIGRAYREVFGKHFPATSLFEVKGLWEPDALIEIECWSLAA
ncbi:MAG: RidA family protein [Candidatus Dormibacteraeota bacterium]|nr:RidA family protein [Candidatus Dormibacteraeota bacterium]